MKYSRFNKICRGDFGTKLRPLIIKNENCKECGSNKNITAHHEILFSKTIKKYYYNYIGKTNVSLKDIRNMVLGEQVDQHNRGLIIPLCRDCHDKIHESTNIRGQGVSYAYKKYKEGDLEYIYHLKIYLKKLYESGELFINEEDVNELYKSFYIIIYGENYNIDSNISEDDKIDKINEDLKRLNLNYKLVAFDVNGSFNAIYLDK